MAVVAECQAIRADQALAHGVEVAGLFVVFGANAVARIAAVAVAAVAVGLEGLRDVKQVEILRQRLGGLLEGGTVVGTLVDLESAEAFGAECVAARQNSRYARNTLRDSCRKIRSRQLLC